MSRWGNYSWPVFGRISQVEWNPRTCVWSLSLTISCQWMFIVVLGMRHGRRKWAFFTIQLHVIFDSCIACCWTDDKMLAKWWSFCKNVEIFADEASMSSLVQDLFRATCTGTFDLRKPLSMDCNWRQTFVYATTNHAILKSNLFSVCYLYLAAESTGMNAAWPHIFVPLLEHERLQMTVTKWYLVFF